MKGDRRILGFLWTPRPPIRQGRTFGIVRSLLDIHGGRREISSASVSKFVDFHIQSFWYTDRFCGSEIQNSPLKFYTLNPI